MKKRTMFASKGLVVSVCVLLFVVGVSITQDAVRQRVNQFVTDTVLRVSGMKVVGSFVPSSKYILRLFLHTTHGDVEIKRNMIGDHIPQLQAIQQLQNMAFDNIAVMPEYVVFIQSSSLAVYTKSTKQLNMIELPAEVAASIPGSSYYVFYAGTLNSQNVLLTFIRDYEQIGSYILNISTKQFQKVAYSGARCGVYCTGLQVAGEAAPNVYYLATRSGDACWGAGEMFVMNVLTMNMKSVFQYNSGCVPSSVYYLGVIQGKILASHSVQRASTESASVNFTIYTDLFAVDQNGMYETLVSSETMPKNIKRISINQKDARIYLSADTNPTKESTVYEYDMQTKSFHQAFQDTLLYFQTPQSAYSTYIQENPSIFKVTYQIKPIAEIVDAKVWKSGIRVTDADGDTLLLITMSDIKKMISIWDTSDMTNVKPYSGTAVQFDMRGKTYIANARTGKVYLLPQ